MKFCRIIALFGALIASTVPDALAASPLITAQVPFAFMVGNRKMPAGSYTVASSASTSSVFYIQGAGHAVAVLSSPADAAVKAGAKPALVFETKGSERYLVGVRMDGEPGRSISSPVFRQSALSASR
jgi:hypothetical protein